MMPFKNFQLLYCFQLIGHNWGYLYLVLLRMCCRFWKWTIHIQVFKDKVTYWCTDRNNFCPRVFSFLCVFVFVLFCFVCLFLFFFFVLFFVYQITNLLFCFVLFFTLVKFNSSSEICLKKAHLSTKFCIF